MWPIAASESWTREATLQATAGHAGLKCQGSGFCMPCGLAQIETEIKDRAEKAQLPTPGAGHDY